MSLNPEMDAKYPKHLKEVLISGSAAEYTQTRHAEKMVGKPGDCGTDLYPTMKNQEGLEIKRLGFYQIWSIPTELHLAVPHGYFAWVTGRSSSYDKLMGCSVIPGIIDHGYTGEYRIRLQVPNEGYAVGGLPIHLALIEALVTYSQKKVALAQFILIPFVKPHYRLVETLPDTPRGTDGYGSTDRGPEYLKEVS